MPQLQDGSFRCAIPNFPPFSKLTKKGTVADAKRAVSHHRSPLRRPRQEIPGYGAASPFVHWSRRLGQGNFNEYADWRGNSCRMHPFYNLYCASYSIRSSAFEVSCFGQRVCIPWRSYGRIVSVLTSHLML